MKLFLMFSLLASSFALTTWAKDPVIDAYLRNDRDYRIRCEFEDKTNFIRSIRTASAPVFKAGHSMNQRFVLETIRGDHDFMLKVFNFNGRPSYELIMDGKKQIGRVEEGNNRYLKKQMRFSGPLMEKVTCYAEFATEPLFPLSDGKYHINVHPHQSFDVRGGSVPATNLVYQDTRLTHIMLLEDNNFKESGVNLFNFLNTGALNIQPTRPSPIMVSYPSSTSILVSPAGVNRYDLRAQDEITIYYTGGNHNYCMFNNITQVLDSLMRSHHSPKLNLVFKQAAIVLQRRGTADGLSFGRWSRIRRSNLFTYVMEDRELQQSYHTAYFRNFADKYFANFSHRFQEVLIDYQAPHYRNRKVIRGSGQRVLQVNFRYE